MPAVGDRTSLIQATSQQTRFNPAIEAATARRELDLMDVSISIGKKDILTGVHLKLNAGVRYLLHGQNGIGKSTVLQAIGERIIFGIPRSLRILLLQQLEDHGDPGIARLEGGDDLHAAHEQERNPIEWVVHSDAEMTRLLREQKVLQAALDSTDPVAAAEAYRQLKHEQRLRDFEEMKKEADLRSGARGKKARLDLIAMEEEVASAMETLTIIEDDKVASEMDQAVLMLAEIQAELEEMDASTASLRAETLLIGLGFTREMLDRPASALSGGWRMRMRLASVLFRPCDVLLLDEPSNFLDFGALLWLQDYLAENLSPKTALLLVTHDRAFADAVADETLIMRDLQIERFPGNLSGYYKDRRKRILRMTRMKEAQEKQVAHIEKTIAGNVKAARQSGDDKKLKQAASRQKKLDERTGIEVGLKGGRFKLNRDLGGYHLTKRAAIEIPKEDEVSRFDLDDRPEDLRFPGPLLSCENLAFTYSRTKAPVISDFTVSIRLEERIAFLGINGSGKSTLISCLLDEDGMKTKGKLSGQVQKHTGAVIGYFSQTAVDQLPPDQTALQYINLGSEQPTRSALASVGLAGKVVSDLPIKALSGGQKVRVALARMMFPVTPHLLVLDEVTTHLDAGTVQNLSDSLRRYKGAVIVVSHDRWFVNSVMGADPLGGAGVEEDDDPSSDDSSEDTAPEGTVYWIDRGKVKLLTGGVEEFERKIRKRTEKERLKQQRIASGH